MSCDRKRTGGKVMVLLSDYFGERDDRKVRMVAIILKKAQIIPVDRKGVKGKDAGRWTKNSGEMIFEEIKGRLAFFLFNI